MKKTLIALIGLFVGFALVEAAYAEAPRFNPSERAYIQKLLRKYGPAYTQQVVNAKTQLMDQMIDSGIAKQVPLISLIRKLSCDIGQDTIPFGTRRQLYQKDCAAHPDLM